MPNITCVGICVPSVSVLIEVEGLFEWYWSLIVNMFRALASYHEETSTGVNIYIYIYDFCMVYCSWALFKKILKYWKNSHLDPHLWRGLLVTSACLMSLRMNPCGLMIKALKCILEVSEFKLRSRHNVQIRRQSR